MNFNKIAVEVDIEWNQMNDFIDILKWCWTENWNWQRNELNRIGAISIH